MKLPGLTDKEIREWLAGPNIARVGTLNEDGTPRITALWYLPEADGSSISLNTHEDNVHVGNIKRDPRVALLIDSCEMPFKSVHYNGVAEVAEEAATPEELGRLYERYLGSREAATEYGRQVISAGKRVNIRFTPDRKRTIDFGKMG